jgi:hypothetical protein
MSYSLFRAPVFLTYTHQPHLYQVAKTMLELDILEKFYTSSCVVKPLLEVLYCNLGMSRLTGLYGKGFSLLKFISSWRFKFQEIFVQKLIRNSKRVNNLIYLRNEFFDHDISYKLGNSEAAYFSNYQRYSLKSLHAANNLRVCFLDIDKLKMIFIICRDAHNHLSHVRHGSPFCQNRKNDVMVFPTLAEGFGLVKLDAIGPGILVSTSPNNNETSILVDRVNSFLVPIRDSDVIEKAIEKIRNMNTITIYTICSRVREIVGLFNCGHFQDALIRLM